MHPIFLQAHVGKSCDCMTKQGIAREHRLTLWGQSHSGCDNTHIFGPYLPLNSLSDLHSQNCQGDVGEA